MKKIIIIIICIILLLYVSIFFIVNSNKRYNSNLINLIYDNTNIKDISYLNKSNNYYVVKDNSNLYVLDSKYNVIIQEDICNIKTSDLEIVYKNKRLLYEKVKDNNYSYYDIYSLKEIDSIKIGG